MKNFLRFLGMVFVLFSVLSIIVLAEEGREHDLIYVGTYFDISKLCDGKLSLNVVLDNNGKSDEEIYVHVYSDGVNFDGFSQIRTVSEGESVMLGISDDVGFIESGFLEGFYDVEVELFNDGLIKNYPEKLYFGGCMKKSSASVFIQSINSDDLERGGKISLEENINNERFSMGFSTILFIVLSVFILLVVVVFIISSYIVV